MSCISCVCCEGFRRRGSRKVVFAIMGGKEHHLRGVRMSLQGPESDSGTDQKKSVKLVNMQIFKHF